jgi:hypothetical protein
MERRSLAEQVKQHPAGAQKRRFIAAVRRRSRSRPTLNESIEMFAQ